MKRILLSLLLIGLAWSPARAETCLSQSSPPTFENGQAVPTVCDTHGTQKVMTVDEDGHYVAGGGGGGGAATIADGADVALGATTDAAATAGGAGTISAKLRNATELIDAGNTTLSTLNAKLPSSGALADDTANPTTTGVAAYNMCFDGSTWDRCVKATAETTGVQVVRPHALLADRVSGVVGITDGSSTSVVAAQGSGVRFCATTLVVSNSSATNVTVDIRDGTAGSVLMTIPAAANMGGGVIPLGVPLCGSANTIFAADPSASASTVTITAVGFKTTL